MEAVSTFICVTVGFGTTIVSRKKEKVSNIFFQNHRGIEHSRCAFITYAVQNSCYYK
jgi:hypothetical protein